MPRRRQPGAKHPRRSAPPSPRPGGRLSLYETEHKGIYHEHWLAPSAFAAAKGAIDHARECGLALDRVDVSTMVFPEDSKTGLVYVANDTRTFAVVRGRLKAVPAGDLAGDKQDGG
jgi:hypothetical protein